MRHKRSTILFVCRENACRSQMAEGFARFYGKDTIEVWSAGSTPRGAVDPGVVTVMQEEGVELHDQRSKGLAQLPHMTWDIVVSMGCGEQCPAIPSRHRFEWNIPDPKGQPLERYRSVRDMIKDSVKNLLVHLSDLVER